jgi:hypothetical protein
MSTLILVLTALVVSLLASAAAYAAAYLTAESDLLFGARQWLARQAKHSDTLERIFDAHDLPQSLSIAQRGLRLFSSLVHCPICSTWWHAAWIIPFLTLSLGCPMRLVFVVYLPAVGLCTLFNAKRSHVAPATTMQELFKRAS